MNPARQELHEGRRRLVARFAGTSPGATLLPGIWWAQLQDATGYHLIRPAKLDA